MNFEIEQVVDRAWHPSLVEWLHSSTAAATVIRPKDRPEANNSRAISVLTR